jgi:hypothetical protein
MDVWTRERFNFPLTTLGMQETGENPGFCAATGCRWSATHCSEVVNQLRDVAFQFRRRGFGVRERQTLALMEGFSRG